MVIKVDLTFDPHPVMPSGGRMTVRGTVEIPVDASIPALLGELARVIKEEQDAKRPPRGTGR